MPPHDPHNPDRTSPSITSEEIGALSPENLARLTGQHGAFRLLSRSLRQSATTTSASLQMACMSLAEQVTAHLRLTLKRKLADNVGLIVLNLYAAYRQDNRFCVSLPMDAAWYSSEQPRNPILSYRITVQQAFKGLEGLGLVERLRTGSPYGGTYSLIRGTPALIGYLDAHAPDVPITALHMAIPPDPIILKGPRPASMKARKDDGDAEQLDAEVALLFPETPETERMRAAVVSVNAVNSPDRIRLPDLGDERHELLDALWKASDNGRQSSHPGDLEAWFAETTLYRIFNRGTFDLGGRFYGAAWQSLPKLWRKRILIDGENVAELDYGSLHPRLLHHLYKGVEAPEDPYAVIDAPRDFVKRAMMALLNMENGTHRPPKWFSVDEAGMRWRDLCDRITTGLPQIVPYIGTGVGLKLQRVDSDIAEAVMLHFAKQDIPCLGIHDSFIVQQRHAAELEMVMQHAYRSRTGFEAVVKRG